ncbi:MAG TPA: tetratricopeptide repeat protein [Symbiobacteriaceae bacterium]|nr:tetratricopeptide repeat protein [Symbiobacteriaceae bacterium]
MPYRWSRVVPLLTLLLMIAGGCGKPAAPVEAPSVPAPAVEPVQPPVAQPPAAQTPPAQSPAADPLAQAESALGRGKKMTAMLLLQDAIKAQPDRYEPHLLLARAYLAVGWWDEAKQEAREVLRLQPGQPDAQGVLDDKPPLAWQVTAPVDPRAGALWRGTVDGRPVYLHANDLVTRVEQASWAGGVEGKTAYGGTFAWYVEPAPGAAPVRQPLLLWSDWAAGNAGPGLGFGGGMRPVSTFQFGGHDVLVIWQVINSNLKEVQFFGWSEQENRLVQYSFRYAGEKGDSKWIAVSGGPEPDGAHLKTQYYDPMSGRTIHTWELQESTFVEVKTEKQP